MSEPIEEQEQVASEFGNGAHVTVPKDWEGHIVYVKKVCPFIPPAFSDVEEEKSVVMDIDTEETLSGEVIDFDVSVNRNNKGVSLDMKVDTGRDFYRVEGERSVGKESWNSDFTVYKAVSGDEAKGSDEIVTIAMNEDNSVLWRPEGVLESIAVKQQMS